MISELAGKVAVFGADGNVVYTGILATQNLIQGFQLTDNFITQRLRDGNGQTVGLGSTDRDHALSISFILVAADTSRASAEALLAAPFPPMLALVNVTGSDAAILNGDWNYVGGGSLSLTSDQYHLMTLPVIRVGSTPAALALSIA